MTVHAYKIPPFARAKMAALEATADQMRTLELATGRRIRDLEDTIGNMPDAPGTEDLEHELSRLRSVMVEQQSRHREKSNLVAQLRGWLRNLPPQANLVDARRSKPAMKKGETVSQAVARIRDEIADLKSKVALVKQAKPPVAEIKKQARAFVQRLAEQGRPAITAGYDQFEIKFATSSWSPAPNLGAALAWLDADRLVHRLEQEIDAMPKPVMALTASERSEQYASLRTELAALERTEERLIDAAADDGQDIARRVDADPRAVLSVSDSNEAAKAVA